MFYYNYVNLCNRKGISPSAAAEEMGFHRSDVTRWSKGVNPRQATIQKVADYFGVSFDELTADTEKAPTPEGERDGELTEYLDMLRTRPECRMLFALAKGATKEDIERAVAIIEALREKEGR